MFTRNRWVAHITRATDIINECRDTAWSDGKSKASSQSLDHYLTRKQGFIRILTSVLVGWIPRAEEDCCYTGIHVGFHVLFVALHTPLVLAGLISWHGIVMALVVVCIPNPQNCGALSLTNHRRPISLSSCLRRLLGVPPAPPHRLRWPLEHSNLPWYPPTYTYHNLQNIIIWTTDWLFAGHQILSPDYWEISPVIYYCHDVPIFNPSFALVVKDEQVWLPR